MSTILRLCVPSSLAVLLVGCNQAPIAIDDEVTTPRGTAVNIPVLENDADPDGDPLILKGVADARKGRTEVNADNTILYMPDELAQGEDLLEYRVADNEGRTSTAKVRVTIGDVVAPSERDAPAGSLLDALLVTFHTADDDKNQAEPVRVILRRADQVLADEVVGVGELWETRTSRTVEINFDPDVRLASADDLRVDVQKVPSGGTGAGASWVAATEIQGRLANGGTISLLPRTEPIKFGDGEPFERTWELEVMGR